MDRIIKLLIEYHLEFVSTQARPSLHLLKCHIVQGSHKLWKSWKTWKIPQKSSMHGKIMEFEKTWIIMEKSWNFVK